MGSKREIEYIVDFFRAAASDWIQKMSGGIGVLFMVGSFWLPADRQPYSFLFVGLACWTVNCYRTWKVVFRRVQELEALPQLRLTFVPGQAPYEQDHVGTREDRLHYFRVGVTHDGLKQAEDVRVMLAELDPAPMGFPRFHCLSPMGEPPGTSSCAVAGGSEPTRFFDVLFQERHEFKVSTAPDPTFKPTITGRPDFTVCLVPEPRTVAATEPRTVPRDGRDGIEKRSLATDQITVPARPSKLRLVAEGRDAKSAEVRLEVTEPDDLVIFKVRRLD